jgi:hypothetical protein
MLVSRDQNADQNRNIKIGNRSFENVSQFKYLGTTVTNQNSRFQVFSTVTMMNAVFWDMFHCSQEECLVTGMFHCSQK